MIARSRLRCVGAAVAILLTSCTAAPDAGRSSPSPTSEEPVIANPVYPFDFPDPQVLLDSDGFLAIATNGNGMNVQTIRGEQLGEWQQGSDALPQVAPWSTSGKVWAPEIIAWPDGGYRLYYTTRAPDPNWQCVSVATSDALAGPYVDESAALFPPFHCEFGRNLTLGRNVFINMGCAFRTRAASPSATGR